MDDIGIVGFGWPQARPAPLQYVVSVRTAPPWPNSFMYDGGHALIVYDDSVEAGQALIGRYRR